MAKLKEVAAAFPEKDANPKYDPLPLQPWDLLQEEKKQKKRKSKNR